MDGDFGLDPASHASMGANPGRQVGESVAEADEVAEVAFDFAALLQQLLSEAGERAEHLKAFESGRTVTTVAEALAPRAAAEREQLEVAASQADVVKFVVVVVGVGQDVALLAAARP